jgi:hypothetical protein
VREQCCNNWSHTNAEAVRETNVYEVEAYSPPWRIEELVEDIKAVILAQLIALGGQASRTRFK